MTGVFNIGSQQAGTINNVAGDQTVGRMDGTMHRGMTAHVTELRSALSGVALPASTRRAVDSLLVEVHDELGRREPDRPQVAARLETMARVLTECGAIVIAGERIVGPLRRLAGWLGVLGGGLLGLLP